MATKYIIHATNKVTGEKQEVSLPVTANELVPYLDQEYKLHKQCPSDRGLYGEFKNIFVKRL